MRDDGGIYQCVATNGVEDEEDDVSSIINLTVHCKFRFIIKTGLSGSSVFSHISLTKLLYDLIQDIS